MLNDKMNDKMSVDRWNIKRQNVKLQNVEPENVNFLIADIRTVSHRAMGPPQMLCKYFVRLGYLAMSTYILWPKLEFDILSFHILDFDKNVVPKRRWENGANESAKEKHWELWFFSQNGFRNVIICTLSNTENLNNFYRKIPFIES
jgi:hypothetical protein